MFRKSNACTQPNLFDNFEGQMTGTRLKKFADPNAWHNVFYKHVTSKIDEEPFSPLFDEGMGRPNVPIRILFGMMSLKEGYGWSDSVMFDECDFNIQVMSALGLTNGSDSVPSEATYYNFRKALYIHQIETGEDLAGDLFRNLTKDQANLFGVTGEFTRMDSKLLGSNICKSSRLQLIIQVIQEFYKDIHKSETLSARLDSTESGIIEELMKKKAGQIIYMLDNVQRDEKLVSLGYLLSGLLNKFTEEDSQKVRLLNRVFHDHYHVEIEKVILKDVKEISSDSLQSAYDEDAAYRKKHNQKIQGYSMNVTESNKPEELKLIGDVKVDKANVADNSFFEGGIKRSEEVFGHIDQSNADGAYYSETNEKLADKNETKLILSGLPGSPSVYAFDKDDNGQVSVTNTLTGEVQKAKEYKEGKYKIKEKGKTKYFDNDCIESYFRRKTMEAIPQEVKNMRNNVESTIFQMSCQLRNNKTRYRGMFKTQLWSYCRAMWVNARRIQIFLGKECPNGSSNGENAPNSALSAAILIKFCSIVKNYVKRNIIESILSLNFGNCFVPQKIIASKEV